MLKLRQWTGKSSTAAAAGDAPAAAGGAPTASSPPASPSSPAVASAALPDSASKHGSDSAAASIASSQPTQDDADADALLEREIERRRTGNTRLNGAVEALWSSLSKKKPLPFDMSNAQLVAALAAVSENDDETSETSGKATSGGVASALADFLPGSKDKDKEKPDSKMIPINALGIAMTSYADLLSTSSSSDATAALPSASTTHALGTSLGLLGRAYIQIAQLQHAFATDMKSVLLTRLARSHVQLDAYAGARKRADAAKSRLDAARAKAQKSKREKRELEDELRIASAAYDDAISELEMRAEAVLYTSEAEDLNALTDYLHSHLDFLHQSVECLERVKEGWAHADDRALNRGINAGTLLSSLHSSAEARPRSRPSSALSNSGNTVRPRKSSSRPGTAGSISAAMAASAGRFGFPSASRTRSDTPDPAASKSAKGGASAKAVEDDEGSDSAVSDDEDSGRATSQKKDEDRKRTKSSGSSTRPTFNRSLTRLGLFGGNSKKDDSQTGVEAAMEKEKPKASSPEKEKPDEKPASISRGWSDTFKAKNWKRDKDRDTGGFAAFGGGMDGLHEQELDEAEQRRRAALLSGVSMGIEDRDAEEPPPPRLPQRASASPGSGVTGPGTGGDARTEWTTFGRSGRGGHAHDASDFDDDGVHLGHGGRRESSATTDIFRDGPSAVGSPLGHSPYPSDGLGMHVGPTGEEARMLAFNNTGLSALSAGEDDGVGRSVAGTADTVMQSKRISRSDPFGQGLHPSAAAAIAGGGAGVHPQNTGLSLGGYTDDSHDHEHDEAQERAVLTSNGASTQTQRYRTGGLLARATSGGVVPLVSGVGGGGGGRGGAPPPPPPVPPSSTLLKSRPPPPPVPNRAAK